MSYWGWGESTPRPRTTQPSARPSEKGTGRPQTASWPIPGKYTEQKCAEVQEQINRLAPKRRTQEEMYFP